MGGRAVTYYFETRPIKDNLNLPVILLFGIVIDNFYFYQIICFIGKNLLNKIFTEKPIIYLESLTVMQLHFKCDLNSMTNAK